MRLVIPTASVDVMAEIHTKYCFRKSFVKRPVGKPGARCEITLRWVLDKWVVTMGRGRNWLSILSNGRFFKCSSRASVREEDLMGPTY
jgi:hypothetical protein